MNIKKIWIICRRELTGYFTSPLAYIFIIIFLLLTGFFTFAAPPFGNFLSTNEASLSNSFFSFQPWLYLILVPPIAMRLWSEELKSGTVELLFTMPISIAETVIGKFLAAWLVIGCSLILTFPYVITVNWLGNPDNGIIIAGYLGSWLLAGSYLSIGCMTSSITKNQIISFILSVVVCLILALSGHPSITDFFTSWAPAWTTTILGKLSVYPHFYAIQKGIITFRDIFYFASIIVFALSSTYVILKVKNATKNKQFFSVIGMLAFLIILININFLSEKTHLRYDITQDKLYTLSKSTKNILNEIKQPVTIRFYTTRGNNMPIPLRLYTGRVENLLKEYVRNSHNNIVLERYNPIQDSDAETSALMDGIKGQITRGGGKFYFGLTVSSLDHNTAISFLSPANEQTLEYDITRSIYDVTHPQKPTIGIISSVPVMGGFSGFMSSQYAQKPPWIFVQELQKVFNVQKIDYSTNHIDKDINVLMVIHPENLSLETEFAIDQYLLKGGKLFIFVDPYCFAAGASSQESHFSKKIPEPSASNLRDLFSAWGIHFSQPKEVVIAPNNAYHALDDPLGKEHPAILSLTGKDINHKDIVMAGVSKINVVFAGAFTGKPKKQLKETVLLKTSPQSELYKDFSYKVPASELAQTFVSDKKPADLIIKLSGIFHTAFPKGSPNNTAEIKSNGGGNTRHAPRRDAKSCVSTDGSGINKNLTVSLKPSSVILAGDADILFNPFCVTVQKVYDQTVIDVINSNLRFVQNAVDNLSGDQDIINIRARGTIKRNFSKIESFYQEAKKKYESKITPLENQLHQTEEYLNKIQSEKTKDQQLVLTEKQLHAIQKFRKIEKRTKKELIAVRKKLRNEIYTLKLWIEIINIALIPLLLVIFGIILSLIKRRKKTFIRE